MNMLPVNKIDLDNLGNYWEMSAPYMRSYTSKDKKYALYRTCVNWVLYRINKYVPRDKDKIYTNLEKIGDFNTYADIRKYIKTNQKTKE